eukprot:Unigene8112_Nuclearia_a/m.24881 Unigene8112_Nuclearia_a/g.24881  ORF Unigene8112_Nuclearia_a/g.24881 Unigene8112_Nuclearia_a/m.24881 type:complete len:1453 (-) Unigene8112_Nuclearia_a:30-4388(-)
MADARAAPAAATTRFWAPIVMNELLAVAAAIRRNARWDMSLAPGASVQSIVLRKLVEVRRIVASAAQGNTTVDDVGISVVVEPFLDIIRSDVTTGPVIGAALSAVEKLLNYQLIHPRQDNVAEVMGDVAVAVTHCKFEATDQVADEVVLTRILHVLKACLASPAGVALSNEMVAQILTTCFQLCFQTRLSELLRRSCEHALTGMAHILLSRLPSMPDGDLTTDLLDDEQGAYRNVGKGLQTLAPGEARSTGSPAASATLAVDTPWPAGPGSVSAAANRPHGVPAVLQLMTFVTSLLDPQDRSVTDTMRLIALNVLGVAIETGGMYFHQFPTLLALVKTDLSHHLYMIISLREQHHTNLLAQSLRVVTLLFSVLGTHMRCHIEFFLTGMLKKLADESRSTLPEHKELVLESLRQLSLGSSFFAVDLYINYDCELRASDMLEKLVRVLSTFVASENAQLNHLHMLAFDVLSSMFKAMAERCELKVPYVPGGAPSLEELQTRKNRKRLLSLGVEKFNASWKDGMRFLCENKLISSAENHADIAHFLWNTPALSKRMLGLYLAESAHGPVLDRYMSHFDFRGKRIDEALRTMCESFRLPGEGQQIDRILASFAAGYMKNEPPLPSVSAAHFMGYAIIMLNTDLYNVNNKRRMTLNDFLRIASKTSDNEEFETKYLEEIYTAISRREIIMPQEQEGLVGEEYAWKQLIAFDKVSDQLIHSSSAAYDREMFMSMWPSAAACVTHLLGLDLEDSMVQQVLYAVRNLATVAGHYRLTEAFESMLAMIVRMTTLVETDAPSARPPGEQEKIPARFVARARCRLATQTAFDMIRQHGSVLHANGWTLVMKSIRSLYREALLPDALLEMEDLLGKKRKLPLARVAPQTPRRDTGGMSYMWPFATFFGDSESRPELDTTSPAYRSTRELVAECRIEDIITDSRFLPQEALGALLDAAMRCSLIESAREQDVQVDEDAALFFFEMTVRVLAKNPDRIKELLERFHLFLTMVFDMAISDAAFPLIERATVGLLLLARRFLHNEEVLGQLFNSITHLVKLPSNILARLAPQISVGMDTLLKDPSLSYTVAQWKTLLALIAHMVEQNDCATLAFSGLDVCILSKEAAWINPVLFFEFADVLLKFVAFSSRIETPAGTPITSQSRSASASSVASAPAPAAAAVPQSSPAAPNGRLATEDETRTPRNRALRALDLLWLMFERARVHFQFDVQRHATSKTVLPETAAHDFFHAFWLPVLSGLSSNGTHPVRDVRTRALTILPEVLVRPELLTLLSADDVWTCHDMVLFSLLEDLISDSFHPDAREAEDARVKSASLLSKLYLHTLPTLYQRRDFPSIWMRVLNFVNKYMHVDGGSRLYDMMRESLVNMILVQRDWGILEDPAHASTTSRGPANGAGGEAMSPESRAEFWHMTWEKINSFLPGLYDELFPPVGDAPPSPSPAAPAAHSVSPA